MGTDRPRVSSSEFAGQAGNAEAKYVFHGNSRYNCFTSKAGECMTSMYVLKIICEEFSTNSLRGRHRIACLESICIIFDICRAHDFRIPRPEADRMLRHCDRFLNHYNCLCKCSMRLGRLNYNFTFKFHFLWHICFFASYVNPSVSWCWKFRILLGP